MALTGRCRCRAIRHALEGEATQTSLRHCGDCRRSSGAPMVGRAMFPRDRIAIEGTRVTYESSAGTPRQFCGICGTGLFHVDDPILSGQIEIRSATLDDRKPCRSSPGSRRPRRRPGSPASTRCRPSSGFRNRHDLLERGRRATT